MFPSQRPGDGVGGVTIVVLSVDPSVLEIVGSSVVVVLISIVVVEVVIRGTVVVVVINGSVVDVVIKGSVVVVVGPKVEPGVVSGDGIGRVVVVISPG